MKRFAVAYLFVPKSQSIEIEIVEAWTELEAYTKHSKCPFTLDKKLSIEELQQIDVKSYMGRLCKERSIVMSAVEIK